MRKNILLKKAVTLGCVLSLSAALIGCGTKSDANSGASDKDGTAQVQPSPTADDTTEETPEATPEDTSDSKGTQASTAEVNQLAEPQKGETVATLHIKDYGDIKVHFFKDAAPKAVENFVTLSKDGYYNGVTFHRVIQDFMIQGGDPQGTGMGGESIWGSGFEDEINKYLIPLRGSLCMANAGGGNTNGSQFFIVQQDAKEATEKGQVRQSLLQYIQMYQQSTGLTLDSYDDSVIDNYLEVGGALYLSGGYTVFGQVYDGLDVVDKIAATKTGENDKPEQDVIIESIDVSTY